MFAAVESIAFKKESAKATDTKVVLLLQPQRIPLRPHALQLLKLRKTGAGLEMDELPLNAGLLKLYLKNAPPAAIAALQKLTDGEIGKVEAQIRAQFKKLPSGIDFDTFRFDALMRHYQQYLGALKQHTGALSFYHRLPDLTFNKVRTTPCQYHSFTVELSFRMMREDDGLRLQVVVQKGKEQHTLQSFRRFAFLLEKDHEYLHLPFRCYEALEQLESVGYTAAPPEEDAYITKIQQLLARYGQVLHTEALLARTEIAPTPEKRIKLSELNNSFLLLTPQYDYDGHIVEGAWEDVVEIKQPGKSVVIRRHQQTEYTFAQYLSTLHPLFAKQLNGYFYLSFSEAQKRGWFLKVYHQLLEQNVQLVGLDLLKHFKVSPHLAATHYLIIGQEGDWIIMSLKVTFGKESVSLHELQKMLWNGQKAVLLKDGSMGVLGDAWLRQFGAIIKHARIREGLLRVPRWLGLGEESNDGIALRQQTIPLDWWTRWENWQQREDPVLALPQGLAVDILRPYQHKGFEWLCLLGELGGGACLADDMGLGKTLQTITLIVYRMGLNPQLPHLVVCPASLIYNWVQEFQKFAPTVEVLVHHGGGRDTALLMNQRNAVIITSYGTMRQDIEHLAELHFDTIVADESHYIKNPSTQVSRAILQLRARFRVALSGTPLMNGTGDLYAQLQFLLPGLLGSREFFNREYAFPIEQQHDVEKAAALQKIIHPFVLRRTKQQAAPDLPEKTESILWCEMGVDQRMAYESLKENIRSSLFLEIEQKGWDKGKMAIIAGLTRLRQICNSAELVKDADIFTTESIKTERLIDELKLLSKNHKVLVFSQFKTMLDLLERDLAAGGLNTLRLDGSTGIADRQQRVNRFQQEDNHERIFLLSLKAGNAGLNLTAADYVFLFDPWWNAAVEHQAIDRTHRIGQQNQVFAYRMICKNTVEEKIMQLSSRKKKLAEHLVTADESFVKSLSPEDLKFLME